MSKRKHTPGPWVFHDRGVDFDNWLITSADGASGIARPVVNIRATMNRNSLPPEARANARLIAAAPRMLDACELALSSLKALGAENATVRLLEIVIGEAKGGA